MKMRIDDLHAANLTKFEASKYRALPKFLLIRFSSIGDIVLTSPVIRCLKEQVPGAEVHFLTRSNFKMVLEHHPQIDKLWTSDGSLDDVAEALKKEKYDAVIDLHHNVRTLKLKEAVEGEVFFLPEIEHRKVAAGEPAYQPHASDTYC
jgi:hypothetical protein